MAAKSLQAKTINGQLTGTTARARAAHAKGEAGAGRQPLTSLRQARAGGGGRGQR